MEKGHEGIYDEIQHEVRERQYNNTRLSDRIDRLEAALETSVIVKISKLETTLAAVRAEIVRSTGQYPSPWELDALPDSAWPTIAEVFQRMTNTKSKNPLCPVCGHRTKDGHCIVCHPSNELERRISASCLKTSNPQISMRIINDKVEAAGAAITGTPFKQWAGWITHLLEHLEVALEKDRVLHDCINAEAAQRRVLQDVQAAITDRLEGGEW